MKGGGAASPRDPWFTAPQALALALAVLLVTVVVRMRPPSSWTQTQFLFDWQQGFQRRGLTGEILRRLVPGQMSAADTRLVAALITLAAMGALFAFVWSAVRRSDGPMILPVLFASSVGLATVIGNTGYLDALLILAALAALLLPASLAGVLGACAILALAAMVHENVLPLFAPLVAAGIWLRSAALPQQRRILLAALPLLTTALASGLVIWQGTQTPAMFDSLVAAARARAADFPVRADTFDPVTALPEGHPHSLAGVWGSDLYRFRLLAFGGLGLLFLFILLRLGLKAAEDRPALDRLALIGATLAPVSLLLVAFDVSRFVALAHVNFYLVLALFLRTDPAFRQRLAAVLSPGVVAVLLIIHGSLMLRDLNAAELYTAGFPGALLPQSTGWGP